ncbi:MAG TPA: TlpA disulfide reductase family protein [Pirellulales bacterium]|nr:TlpA disulfide reductase family protein [Pirellulales bacterium]
MQPIQETTSVTARRPMAQWLSLPCLAIGCLTFGCLAMAGCQRGNDAAAMPLADIRQSVAEVPPTVETPVAGETSGSQPADEAAVTLELLDFAGIEQLIASHLGKVVVMDAWSTSCPPCVAEFPKLVALSHQFGKDQLACVSLSFDYEGIGQPIEKKQRVAEFLASQHATFDNVLASEESDVMYRKFHLPSVPAVFVYDKTGALRHRFDNLKAKTAAEHFTYEDVGQLVEQLLAEPVASEGPPSN